ncbi:MAG: enoyl-CoA hydratase [Alphaproteobacteria bacterium]|nr:enoyl-CoA hydratase [Alphaproteobacteria bacterium]
MQLATDKMIARKAGGAGWMIFNNPARHNAVSLEMWEAAAAIIEDFVHDDGIRVIVVTGAGEKAFVAGADISRFESERASEGAVERYGAATDRAFAALANASKPTIAKIRGYCIGGGVGLAVCCDLRIVAEDARFGVPAAKLGLGYGIDGVRRLADVVGPAYTKEIFYTARQFSAAEAERMGLANRVVPVAELDAFVDGYIETIVANAPLTIAAVKRAMVELMKDPAERDVAACDRMVADCFASADYTEGRRAFMEKRKPAFRGR